MLLLDEPFGALDAKVRLELRRWLRHLHDEVNITSLFVTHDQEEALEVADSVAVMNEGKFEQIGTPAEVYENPATSFVFKFLGNVNLFHGRIDNGVTYIQQTATDHVVFVRPHLLDIVREAPSHGSNAFQATIVHINAAGPLVKIEAQAEWGARVQVEMPQQHFRDLSLNKGEQVFVVPHELAVFKNGEVKETADS
jgi:sulfate transport system ATP-binding protein